MIYRGDIDGLRAVAVLAVIAFHFQLGTWASGGFVGVDIFFVVSGYLITKVIADGIRDGSFSLADFYHRRINRIFPALFTVFVACIASSFLLDYNTDAQETAKSLIASTLFASNLFFYMTTDYFSRHSEANPLLHTWSLSVEEQFYLFFPLLMLVLRRWSVRIGIVALAAIAASSFAWACWSIGTDKAAAFYLMPSRAWELLVGALLASRAFPAVTSGWATEGLSILGFTLLLGSITLIDALMPFPGALAAVPCLGAAAIIHAGGRTSVGRLLRLRPLRYVGLISYSLYLWHWPVLVYFRRIDDLHGHAKIVLPLVCVALAAFSYHFIEQPFRARRRQDARRVFGVAAVAMATCAILGVGLVRLAPLIHPPSEAASVLSYVRYDLNDKVRDGTCFLTDRRGEFRNFRQDDCLAWDPDRRNVMLLGDSYAAHLWPGLTAVHREVNFLQATASQCKPMLPAQGLRRCQDLLTYLTQTFLVSHRPDEIILAARWRAEDLPTLLHTIETLRPFTGRIVVIGPIVEYEQSLPRLLAREILTNSDALAASYRSLTPMTADRALSTGLAGVSVTYVSLLDLLCTPNCLVWARPGQPLQFDFGHLTSEGSTAVALRLGSGLFAAP